MVEIIGIQNPVCIWVKKEIKDSFVFIYPSDYSYGLYNELMNSGFIFDHVKLSFYIQESKFTNSMQSILNFYTSSNKSLTNLQRKFRDEFIKDSMNEDAHMIRYNNSWHYINTNGLAGDFSNIKKLISKRNLEFIRIINNTRIIFK
jgi:hypothetical protein